MSQTDHSTHATESRLAGQPAAGKPNFVKRRQRLIKSGLQLKLIATFAGIALLAQLFQTLLMTSYLAQLAGRMPAGGQYLADATPGLVGKALLVSSVVLLPLILLVGIAATFRLAGPLYAIDRFLKGVRDGQRSGALRLRRGDQLQDLCEVVNEVTEPLRDQIAERAAAEATDGESRRAA